MLTERQKEVLRFLEESFRESGFMPTTREIQDRFGFASQTGALNHLRALQKKGAISRMAGKARAMALAGVPRRQRSIDVPIFGQIPAGMATLMEQENEGWLSVNADAVGVSPKARVFALRVRGDSMIEAHVVDRDLAVFEIREPKSGDIVAALIDGETTLKRYLIRNSVPYLKAENPAYPDLIPVQELLVQGVMVTLVRTC